MVRAAAGDSDSVLDKRHRWSAKKITLLRKSKRGEAGDLSRQKAQLKSRLRFLDSCKWIKDQIADSVQGPLDIDGEARDVFIRS